MRNKVIPAVFLILEKTNKVLLLERSNTGWNDGMYTLPSGHVEENESPIQAIVREAYEEVGIEVTEDNLDLKTVLYRKSNEEEERVDFIFVTTKWNNEPSNREQDKSSGILWCEKDNLPDNTIDFIRRVIVSEDKYIELGYLL